MKIIFILLSVLVSKLAFADSLDCSIYNGKKLQLVKPDTYRIYGDKMVYEASIGMNDGKNVLFMKISERSETGAVIEPGVIAQVVAQGSTEIFKSGQKAGLIVNYNPKSKLDPVGNSIVCTVQLDAQR